MLQMIPWIILAPVWFWFMLQPIQNHIIDVKEQYIQNVTATAIQEAKIKGYFTQTDLTTIQDKVASGMGYPAPEVTVSGTTTPEPLGQEIYLSVHAPAKLQFLNLSGGNNTVTIGNKDTAMSEALTQ